MRVNMKTFLEHLMESDREYKYRIKVAAPISDEQMAALERTLQPYELRDVSLPKKTIIQHTPLDFPELKDVEVYIIDVVTGVSASSFVLKQQIRQCLGLHDKFVVVRSENDPLELETAKIVAHNEIDDMVEKNNLQPESLLGTAMDHPEYNHVDPNTLAGNKYNQTFLQMLANVAASRKSTVVNFENGINTPKMPEYTEAEDFNSGIKDCVKPVPASKTSSSEGFADLNYKWNNNQSFRKVYTDKKGNQVIIIDNRKGKK